MGSGSPDVICVSGEEDRELGECSPSPNPQEASTSCKTVQPSCSESRLVISESTQSSCVSLIELDDSDQGSADDSIIVIDETNSDGSTSKDRLFVLDTDPGQVEGPGTNEFTPPESDNNNALTLSDQSESQALSSSKCCSPAIDMKKVLTVNEPEAEPEKKSRRNKWVMCFNCEGEHTLDKCSEPRDARRIMMNRMKQQSNRKSVGERYVHNEDSDTKEFRPGVISDELREALGIGLNEIPEWIYRMRHKGFIDGYPPGYLKLAVEENHSNNDLLEFHSDDKRYETYSETADTPTRRKETIERGPPKINADKMIFYFGFNKFSRSLTDRDRGLYRIPPFDEFVEYYQNHLNRVYKEKRKDDINNKKRHKRFDDSESEGDELNMKKKKESASHDAEELIELGDEEDEKYNDVVYVIPPNKDELSEDDSSSKGSRHVQMSKNGKNNATVTIETENATVLCTPEKPTGIHLGNVVSTVCGTPIGLSHQETTPMREKPKLENFRNGIVPFHAEEEGNENKGFFRRLMDKIKMKHIAAKSSSGSP
ncbi:hypothetical protein AB6A40_001871 [Gnathostoma spinigerum]|uniref:PSP proline-rich domain-containing protein n=1 Tax=Gnathostoma spinigerum TaxID=75299 RepID=A0ABD6E7C2_9BILA